VFANVSDDRVRGFVENAWRRRSSTRPTDAVRGTGARLDNGGRLSGDRVPHAHAPKFEILSQPVVTGAMVTRLVAVGFGRVFGRVGADCAA
jgi:hypothetical protein